ncbi:MULTISPECIES: DUF4256 domain-containing protein [Antarcticibacterium]|nr:MULTISPECIES: DUF4256 domain-containing protein [Antarcticibacterium]
MKNKEEFTKEQQEDLLKVLKARFEKNMQRHKDMVWAAVENRLKDISSAKEFKALHQMEMTGGEPDVVAQDRETGKYIFFDCTGESPKGRRSLCYDREAQETRKEYKPKDNVVDLAAAMGFELLTEEDYRYLQQLGEFDTKTSSWVHTPAAIRSLGGALFCDRRYGHVFTYHNGAQSYYAARGFRGKLKV